MGFVSNPDYSAYPRPYEGIAGIDRSDDPLMSLKPTAISAREAIRVVGLHLRNATLVGNPAPVVQRMRDRMRNPQVGDLVTEESTAYHPLDVTRFSDTWPFSRMGYLIIIREEWAQTDEEHAEYLASEREVTGDDSPEERLTDRVTYIQYGPVPGDVCRWENCSFTTIPTDLEEFSKPVGTSTPSGGVSIDRAAMVDALADSGFEGKP